MLYIVAAIVIVLVAVQAFIYTRARRSTGRIQKAFDRARDPQADAAARFEAYDSVLSFILAARGNREMPLARVAFWLDRAGYASLDGVDALYRAKGIAADTGPVRAILREIDAFLNDRAHTDRAGNIKPGSVALYREMRSRLAAAWEDLPRV